ncbi:caspase domain-containing protein [Rhizoctonia solani]|nr:caspase domain-containing protein [Rhizoctonia solani]
MLHALIIGIDDYPKLVKLAGAKADAEKMVTFLTSDLKVPKGNITKLFDKQASRQAIIDAFGMLKSDNRIQKGDPILIFFAGHGGLTNAPPLWKEKNGTNKIQVIFPYDYDLPDPQTNGPVNCIPDTTIAKLLNQLAEVRGNNITVIFDSCHSASGTRDDLQSPGRRARSAEILFPIPHDIDDDIFTHDSVSLKVQRGSELLLDSDQASHIHISACGSNQKAWEENGKGFFTPALLDTLRRSGVDNITYENLIKALPTLPSQSPHCYGQNKDRILFHSYLRLQAKAFVPVVYTPSANGYSLSLQTGEASGVTENSVWALHESPTEDSPSFATVTTGRPEILTTPLHAMNPKDGRITRWLDQLANKPSRPSENRVYARRLRASQVPEIGVWCTSQSLRSLLPTTTPGAPGNTADEFGYVMSKEKNKDDIQLEIYPGSSSQVRFRLHHRAAGKYGVTELGHSKPAIREEIETVLFAAARWKWHLQRSNLLHNHKNQIESMKIMKVATKVGRGREYLNKPVVMKEMSSGLVEFTTKPNDLYGIELVSCANSPPLYIRVFFFDAMDFSIGDMFGHSVANGPEDAILQAGQKIVIGDGQDGGAPLRFTVSPENKIELGYLKVFWCTGPFELSDLKQRSAFEMRPGTVGRAVGRASAAKKHDWGTICLTLVLKAA